MSDEPKVEAGPEPVAKAVDRYLGEWVKVKCGSAACGIEFMALRERNRGFCPPCEEALALAERHKAEAKLVAKHCRSWVEPWCAHVGMTTREASAELSKVPPALERLLRSPGLEVGSSMLKGVTPANGFGFYGPTGTGKTLALAAVLKRMALERWLRLAPTQGLASKRQFARWVRWPEVVAEFRLTATQDGAQQETAALVECWSEVEVLVLDDLGAERARDDYASDWTTSLLDLVVDRRYNELRPTWWTTNLNLAEFVQRYGTRLFSRLTGQNPAFEVPAGPDLRVVRAPAEVKA
jgi:hypothetical protein